jgi:predicted transcriptional regulator
MKRSKQEGAANTSHSGARIIRALSYQNLATDQLQSILSAETAKASTAQIIQRLRDEGLIVPAARGSSVWTLTERGREVSLRASRLEPREWRPYQREKIVRRLGSDRASMLPSLAAGVLRWRQP